MSETVVLYRNRDSWVEANPGDGVVHIRAKRQPPNSRYPDWLGHTITANGREPVPWKPWTWGHKTVADAMSEAIARCDRAEREAEKGRHNLDIARRMVEEFQAKAEALAAVDQMLAPPTTSESAE